jgi:hypothetical protein
MKVLLEACEDGPDLLWLHHIATSDTDNLPDPAILAAEIVEDLQAALDQFAQIASDLAKTGPAAASEPQAVRQSEKAETVGTQDRYSRELSVTSIFENPAVVLDPTKSNFFPLSSQSHPVPSPTVPPPPSTLTLRSERDGSALPSSIIEGKKGRCHDNSDCPQPNPPPPPHGNPEMHKNQNSQTNGHPLTNS